MTFLNRLGTSSERDSSEPPIEVRLVTLTTNDGAAGIGQGRGCFAQSSAAGTSLKHPLIRNGRRSILASQRTPGRIEATRPRSPPTPPRRPDRHSSTPVTLRWAVSPRARGGGGRSRDDFPPFDYVRPADLDEALRILKEREGEAKMLVGRLQPAPAAQAAARPARRSWSTSGTSTGLDGIAETDDDLRIGARATHRRSTRTASIAERYPLLHDAAGGDRRPAGPQLGHDRRLGRPRRPVVGLAGRAPRRQRQRRLPQRAAASA